MKMIKFMLASFALIAMIAGVSAYIIFVYEYDSTIEIIPYTTGELGVYLDPDCSIELGAIDFGQLHPGQDAVTEVYIKHLGPGTIKVNVYAINLPETLTFNAYYWETDDWLPLEYTYLASQEIMHGKFVVTVGDTDDMGIEDFKIRIESNTVNGA